MVNIMTESNSKIEKKPSYLSFKFENDSKTTDSTFNEINSTNDQSKIKLGVSPGLAFSMISNIRFFIMFFFLFFLILQLWGYEI
jgi:hypothetical protein